MTTVIDQFSSAALSRATIYQSSDSRSSSNRGQELLTESANVLQFRIGDSLHVTLEGNGSEPSALWRVLEGLKGVGSLHENWDSYAAPAISTSAIKRAVSHLHLFLQSDSRTPQVVPMRDGGVQFEWHGEGVDVEISVPPSAPISYLIAIDGRPEIEGVGVPDLALLKDALLRIG
jgi:hypothetical protein